MVKGVSSSDRASKKKIEGTKVVVKRRTTNWRRKGTASDILVCKRVEGRLRKKEEVVMVLTWFFPDLETYI